MHREAKAEMRVVIKFAPVEIIQSIKPALIKGISADMPSPAGVKAPVSVTPTVTSGSRHLLRKQPARFTQTGRVVSDECGVDEIGKFGLAGYRGGIDAAATQKFALLFCQDCQRLIFCVDANAKKE
jgi:hypothetical protein